MKALVTGANGLIGANLVRELVRGGHEVTGLVRPGAALSVLEGLPLRLAVGDVLAPDSLAGAVAGQEVVFHTAVAFSYWGHAPDDLATTATDGSLNVLAAAAAAGVRRVVMTSSSVTLGASYRPEVRDEDARAEDDPGESAYVLAKIAQERAAREAAERLGIEVVFACPTMSVGAFANRLGPSNGVVTSYLADPFRLTWAGGCNIASVRDVAAGHVLLARRGEPGACYVLGGENLTWRDIHSTVARLAGAPPPAAQASAVGCYALAVAEEARARLTGRPPLATRAQARMVGRYYWYSHARAAALGYAPRPARAALADAVAWLSASSHVSRETRAGMRLSREVHAARLARQTEERALLQGAPA
ncbi:NAD-dependent epimerase/dehydratase family protein [Phenylobacterium sp.]|uniref:NAD-dependent epimerase/dehydratase family protein n=1 Tax=Phenylobacterium sp. TaxID=1871053 RepID=UPI0025D71420|nr:NAD-dependent epimerase/dehydratase family protein [Phenylobacterium sp.]MBX3484890.1 NAD-dependent epimerase/dehydratase family protein [Phenylobacterium sp.]